MWLVGRNKGGHKCSEVLRPRTHCALQTQALPPPRTQGRGGSVGWGRQWGRAWRAGCTTPNVQKYFRGVSRGPKANPKLTLHGAIARLFKGA